MARYSSKQRTRLTLHPDQDGAGQLRDRYGERLVCIRYRYDETKKQRWKTVELIVEEWPWAAPLPRRKKEDIVLVKVAFHERELRQHIKEGGGVWNPDQQAWEMRYDRAIALGLTQRIVDEASY